MFRATLLAIQELKWPEMLHEGLENRAAVWPDMKSR